MLHHQRPLTSAIGTLLLVVVLCPGSAAAQEPPRSTSSRLEHSASDPPLARAAAFLWDQQAADGGWHSETYGLLKSGQALTPFILHSLLNVPDRVYRASPGKVERALDFIRHHTSAAGVLGMSDVDILEYPNYSTAYALRCLLLAGRDVDRELIACMRSYLAAEQFGPDRGFATSSLAFGGWGFGGTQAPGETGHMDLAHTRRVLQSLREAGVQDAELYARSECLLRLLQKHPTDPRLQPGMPAAAQPVSRTSYDGGFYFSPVVLAANKGRADHARAEFRSYATATCDGLLSLLAAGVPAGDPRVRSAVHWLKAHPRWEYPQGVPTDYPEPWGEAIYFYHLAVRAEAYSALKMEGAWPAELTRLLRSQQRIDGSFVNTRSHLMKEDDPLLATSLGIIALSHASGSNP